MHSATGLVDEPWPSCDPVTFTLIGVARGQATDWRVASRPVVGVSCSYRLLQPLSRLSNFDDIICLWLYSPLLDFSHFYSFLIFNTVGRFSWTGDQSVIWPLPGHSTAETQNKCTHRHPCLEWDLNSRSQCLSRRRQFMLQTSRPATVIGNFDEMDPLNKHRNA
jgi:hypothetical protein